MSERRGKSPLVSRCTKKLCDAKNEKRIGISIIDTHMTTLGSYSYIIIYDLSTDIYYGR